jgi:hypothetical protein
MRVNQAANFGKQKDTEEHKERTQRGTKEQRFLSFNRQCKFWDCSLKQRFIPVENNKNISHSPNLGKKKTVKDLFSIYHFSTINFAGGMVLFPADLTK